MAFTKVEDVAAQETKPFALPYTASGTIKAGQGVAVSGSAETVRVNSIDGTTAGNCYGSAFVGVAAYGASDGDEFGVYGPGSLVNTRVSGTVHPGNILTPYKEGYLIAHPGVASGNSVVAGVAMEDANNEETCKVMLK